MPVRLADTPAIRALPLFSEMSEQSFAEMMDRSMLQRFPARADIIREGEMPDFLYVVVEGTIDLFATRDGVESTIDILYPVSSFILAAVVRDEPYLKSARTLAPSQLLMVPSQVVRDTFTRDAAFARGIVGELAARYRSVTRVLKNDRMLSSTERLASWVLSSARRAGRDSFELPLEKRKLASYLGMTPESYSRGMTALEQHGVSSHGATITVTDAARLKEFVRPAMNEDI
ncbi:helix-turn-helix domain-containing protein [Pseudolabrys sp. Root1462]|uniref:helix-turn-helix domain-containing protein n=1 Tax=Pseudolabrys sp. Root1462 TaxID=1736466 RepID=UPI0009E97F95|nr:helix-turn-helix domain-containing protein [Pseudolabrys sp. Root1462]